MVNNKIFTAVITVILTTAASTFVANIINDSRDAIVQKLSHIDYRLNKLENVNESATASLQKVHERLAAVRSDIRNIDTNAKNERTANEEFTKEFALKLEYLNKQIAEVKRRFKIL